MYQRMMKIKESQTKYNKTHKEKINEMATIMATTSPNDSVDFVQVSLSDLTPTAPSTVPSKILTVTCSERKTTGGSTI